MRAVALQAITGAAVRLGAHAKYRSAGTVEFLVDDDTGKFYFLEVLLSSNPHQSPRAVPCGGRPRLQAWLRPAVRWNATTQQCKNVEFLSYFWSDSR